MTTWTTDAERIATALYEANDEQVATPAEVQQVLEDPDALAPDRAELVREVAEEMGVRYTAAKHTPETLESALIDLLAAEELPEAAAYNDEGMPTATVQETRVLGANEMGSTYLTRDRGVELELDDGTTFLLTIQQRH